MTITSSILCEQNPPVCYGQAQINDSSGSIDVVKGTTQAVSGSSGVTNVITLTGANAAIAPGMVVTGTNVATGTVVASISGVTLTLNKNTTGNAGTLTFSLTGKVIRVWKFDLCVAAGSDLTFNSLNAVGPVQTPLYGPVGLAGTLVNALFRPFPTIRVPHFQTLVGDSLQLIASAVRVSGTVTFTIESP